MLASVLTYSEGRILKQPVKESMFIPDYLGARTVTHQPTPDEQAAQFKAFHGKLKALQGK